MLALLAAAALAAQVPSDSALSDSASLGSSPPAVPAPVQGAELWRSARVGMSSAQVRALFPYGRAPPPVLLTLPPVANAVVGGVAGWAVDDVVFGSPALATYYFGPKGLLEVVVGVKDLRVRHTRDNVDIARGIRAGLLGYYGQPKLCLDTSRRGLDRLDCRWVTRSVQVGLSYIDYGGLGPNLDVAVRAPVPKDRETGEVFRLRGVSF